MSEEALKQKQEIVDEIKSKLDGAQSAVLVDYIGITVAEADELRKNLREANVDYSVYKNTMMKRAVEGTEFEGLADLMKGPSAIAISKDDATAGARILNEAIKKYKKMEFKGGVVEGVFYDKEGITQIADIPSREVLLAKFLGSIQSPVSKFVRTLAAIADAKPEDGAAPEEAKEEAAPAAEAAPAEAAEAEAAPEQKEAEAPAEEAKPEE
ncbi:MAG: 50S ribosomal protein L10 [Anaerovoracaceae bacterium]|jgi:large subunit ribosomal protein L10